MIHCEACGVVPVPKADLPVRLPDNVAFDKPGNPLDRHPTWRHVACPHCAGAARRETDTMDTFVNSSWYFARFTDPWNETAPTTLREADAWLPVDQYIEHRARHPASALLALLRQGHAQDGPSRPRRTVPRPLHPGHGDPRDLSGQGRHLGSRPRYASTTTETGVAPSTA